MPTDRPAFAEYLHAVERHRSLCGYFNRALLKESVPIPPDIREHDAALRAAFDAAVVESITVARRAEVAKYPSGQMPC